MDDVRLGALFLAARLKRDWPQEDVAERAGVPPKRVSRLEHGQLGRVPVDDLRRVARVLEIDVDIRARWRGGEGERLLSARHSALAEACIKRLVPDAWAPHPEVSFSIWGERGVIDILAWHAATRTLLVIEVKTEIIDVGELLGTLDRKRRLAPRVAADLGLEPTCVAVLVVLLDTPTNHRRLADHAATIRSALPADGRRASAWLRHPDGPLAGLMFLSTRPTGRLGVEGAGQRRVRARSGKPMATRPRTTERGLAQQMPNQDDEATIGAPDFKAKRPQGPNR